MLRDLDLSVAAFLSHLLPAGSEACLGPPQAAQAQSARGVPVLGAFLYDVREAQAPAADATLARDDDGRPAGWQRPVRRYQVSYLLTAWPGDDAPGREPPGDSAAEHEMLGEVLAGCAVAAAIPADCLHGVLAEAGEPVPLLCAGADRAAAATQLWPGLGVPARAALDLRVVAPVVPPLITELAPAVRGLEVGVQRQPPPTAQPAPGQQGWERRHITES
ncbi:MAG TPA: Pvc16 family protein [Streptosporangiaceae bacterium]